MPRPLLLAALLLALPVLAAEARADLPADLARVEVVPGWQTESGTLMAGLRITLAPGWKTYWRAPGAAGIPPYVTWDGSRNVTAAAFHWPVPRVFDQGGMRSIGYDGQVLIPVEITPAAPGAPAHVAGRVEIGVCHDICVPMTLDFAADLPAEGRRNGAIVAALVDRPLTGAEAGLTAAACRLVPSDDGLILTATLTLPPLGPGEVVVVEAADPALFVAEPEVARSGESLTATAEIIARDGAPLAVDRAGLRFTVLADGRAVDVQGCAAG